MMFLPDNPGNSLAVELPYPPSVNNYWRRAGHRLHISHAGRKFRERVVGILGRLNVQPLEGNLHVEVDVFPPDRRRRDLDNVQKALFDALEHGGAYADDCQMVRIILTRMAVVAGGKVAVRIRRVP